VTRGLRLLLLVLIVVLAGLIGFCVSLLSPVKRSDPFTVSFVVLPGENVHEIAVNLETVGLLRSHRAFELLALVKGDSRKVKAGPYRAASDEWAWEILDRLVSGDFQDTSVTVPEGLWIAEVADRVGPFVEGGADSFRVAARDTVLLRSLGIPGADAEGYLFPDTYRLILPTPPRSLVRQMVRTFLQVWDSELAGRARLRQISRDDAVVLASIVEAEAQVPAEQPRIAAVYLNRLEQGLRLQADPTVHYAMGTRPARTLYDDLEIPSPYNTYLHAGLPPGPIGNPGLGALKAVLWPRENCEDLYFVAQGDGTHLFSVDYRGHLRNIRIVQQKRKNSAEADP
jgi:UPF0755 protein